MAERGVDEPLLAAVVQHGDDTAGPAALEVLVRLDHQTEPVGFMLRRQDTHAGHAEHHRCRRAAVTTVHVVEAFADQVAWSLLIMEASTRLQPHLRYRRVTLSPRSTPKSHEQGAQ